jgi:hypothetical protein
MKYKILVLILVIFTSGCTTLIANEVNRDREKRGECTQRPRCLDPVKAALADIAIATYVVNELMEQMPPDQSGPAVDIGDVQCESSAKKICSTSLGCQCEPADAREQAP